MTHSSLLRFLFIIFFRFVPKIRNIVCWQRLIKGKETNLTYFPCSFADRFGRRTMCVACAAAVAVVGISAAFVETYVQFLALRFIIALLCAGLMVISFVLGESRPVDCPAG